MKSESFEWHRRWCRRCGKLFRTIFRSSEICPKCDHSTHFIVMCKIADRNGIERPKVMVENHEG